MATVGGRLLQVPMTSEEKRVILASSLGTVFETYDFYLAGSLAAYISKSFFSGVNPTAAFIFTLLSFAAGFAVRPFGAVVFGRLGDLVGRKSMFLVTIVIMGLSTFLVGLLPGYASIGIASPIIFVGMRMLQGLSLGGDYGGAVTFVAEHAPPTRRGFYTAWIQSMATLGFFLSLLTILGIRAVIGEEAFVRWGWRVPFLISILLLATSVWMRSQLHESPVFARIKAEGKISKAPLTEAFGRWSNLRVVIVALFGLTAGQAAVWYTGQFYTLFFLTQTLKVDATTAYIIVAVALAIGTPFFVYFGSLSDRIGRKPIILGGMLIAALTYFPLFKALTHYANPALESASIRAPIYVIADPGECSFQFNPVGVAKFTTSCDIAKGALSRGGFNYGNVVGPAGKRAQIKVGDTTIDSYDGQAPDAKNASKLFDTRLSSTLKAAGYPSKAEPSQINRTMTVAILTIFIVLVTMVYGPLAAMLVEMFPAQIRYTSMSLPYHIGNGWFGGFMPATAFAIVAVTGNIYSGLWYPTVVVAITCVIGLIFVRETKDTDISRED